MHSNNYLLWQFLYEGKPAPIYYWRDHGGHEVDLLVEYAGNLLAFEIKSGMTLTKDFVKGIHKWQSITNIPKKHCHVIYAGEEKMTFQDVVILPWKSEFGATLNNR